MGTELMAQAMQAKAEALRLQNGSETGAHHLQPSANATSQISTGLVGTQPSGQPLTSPISLTEALLPQQHGQRIETDVHTNTLADTEVSERTTIMLRNLPNDYTRAMALELLDEHGFAGCYNFVYLPMDYHRKCGLGYAFVNMVIPSDAERAFDTLQGFSKWNV